MKQYTTEQIHQAVNGIRHRSRMTVPDQIIVWLPNKKT